MMKRILTLLVLATVVAIAAAILHFSGWLYRPVSQQSPSGGINHSALIAIASGLEAARVSPPDQGYSEYSVEDGKRPVRIQFVDGKPAVIGAGPDSVFGTTDDIIVHYEIE